MNVCVIVASLGRPDSVAVLLDRLAGQTQWPSQVILSMNSPADAPPALSGGYPGAVRRCNTPVMAASAYRNGFIARRRARTP